MAVVEAPAPESIVRAWRTEIAPTRAQAAMLRRYIGSARWVFNWGLALNREAWEQRESENAKVFLSKFTLSRQLTELKSEPEYSWLNDTPRTTLEAALTQVEFGYKNWWRELKRFRQGQRPDMPGPPRFKSRDNARQSCRFRGKLVVEGDAVRLPLIGWLKLKERGYVPTLPRDDVNEIGVQHEAGRFWCSVNGDWPTAALIEDYIKPTHGVANIWIQDGEVVVRCRGVREYYPLPGLDQHDERKRKRLQRRISRRTQFDEDGHKLREQSNRRQDALLRFQKFEARLASRREHAVHNLSTQLVRRHAGFVVCKPQVKQAVAEAEKTQRSSLLAQNQGEFFRQLEYKSGWQNRTYAEQAGE